MARKRQSKFAPVRHPFLYRLHFPANGTPTIKKAMARVRYSTAPVTLTLTAAHVRKSMRLGGAGRTDICAGAICTTEQADAFPHTVKGGLDFQYARVFIPSKLNKVGLPSECYVYEHAAGEVAKLNDSKGGQKKLLARIMRDGPIEIILKPHRVRSVVGRSGQGRGTTGARARTVGRGAKLRYAVMQMGGPPE